MLKKTVPLIITFVFGAFMVLEYFIPARVVAQGKEHFYNAGMAIMGVTYLLGLANIVLVNFPKIRRKEHDWPYKIVLLIGMAWMLGVGIPYSIIKLGSDEAAKQKLGETLFMLTFDHAYVPLQATMFALLAFFIASAAFRAFRARTPEAALLLVAALMVMIGRVPIGQFIWDIVPWDTMGTAGEGLGKDPFLWSWIMDIPNLAGKRAIMIGAALGAVATGLRVILGLERSYMGGE